VAWIFHKNLSPTTAELFSQMRKKHMKTHETPVASPIQTTQGAARSTDYAAWLDQEGREHLITRDMVDTMIADLVSDRDYSLQGPAVTLNPEQKVFKYSQNRPHWGE
jgi:hypothetical protein